MLKSLSVRNFTAFAEADLDFASGLNVFVGENGTGKTHLLKLAWCVLAVVTDIERRGLPITGSHLQPRLAEKLVGTFRPDSLGRLVRRAPGRNRCDVTVGCLHQEPLAFHFATNSRSEVALDSSPACWLPPEVCDRAEPSPLPSPAFLPTRELLTIYPGFVSVYEGHYLEFEETWRDTCLLLGRPLQRGPKEKRSRAILAPLEEAMGGRIELDQNGRFYLRNAEGRMEMPLVAEGLRKLGMVARMVATGTLLDQGFLFWDEPDANLNPRLIQKVAAVILDLVGNGIQVFLATHSLFLLRELDILLASARYRGLRRRFFGLHREQDGVRVEAGDSVDEIGPIASLDEQLAQSDRYLDLEV